MTHLGSNATSNQELMAEHVHSNHSNNLLPLNYQLEHAGNLTIDLGASSNTQNSNSTNLTNASNSPSNLNDKNSANNHLHTGHLQHSSSNQLNHHLQYNQIHHHHQPTAILNTNNVSLYSTNQCENHNNSTALIPVPGSPIMDLNNSYNQTNGSTTNRNGHATSSNTPSNSRMSPNNEESTGQVVIKTENDNLSVYSLSEDYLAQQPNCSDNYRTEIVKLENSENNCSVGNNSLNNVTVSYSTSGYNSYDHLQLGNLSTQLILHPASPLLGSTSHLQNALNNHSLHQSNLHLVTSSPSLSGIHHSVIVENNDSNQQSPKSKTNNDQNEQSNYNLTLMTAAAVTNSNNNLQQQSFIQGASSNDTFGIPNAKRSRRSQSSSNFNTLHSIDHLEDDHLHLHQQSTNLNNQQQQQLHSQHLHHHQVHPNQQLQSLNSQMSVDFNLYPDNQVSSGWGDEYNYLYIPKI